MVRFQGSPSRDQEDGKVFPASLDAYEIRDILVRESKAKNPVQLQGFFTE